MNELPKALETGGVVPMELLRLSNTAGTYDIGLPEKEKKDFVTNPQWICVEFSFELTSSIYFQFFGCCFRACLSFALLTPFFLIPVKTPDKKSVTAPYVYNTSTNDFSMFLGGREEDMPE